MKTYTGYEPRILTSKTRPTRYVKTGEFRAPKRGELFLSGAIPEVYKAPNDLSMAYNIMKAVDMSQVPEEVVVGGFTYRLV